MAPGRYALRLFLGRALADRRIFAAGHGSNTVESLLALLAECVVRSEVDAFLERVLRALRDDVSHLLAFLFRVDRACVSAAE